MFITIVFSHCSYVQLILCPLFVLELDFDGCGLWVMDPSIWYDPVLGLTAEGVRANLFRMRYHCTT
jgi:hypothetical protein